MRRLALFALLVFAAYLATGVTQVGPDERAVVTRFGAVVARPGPGLWVGLPWGIDRVERVQVRTARQLVVGFAEDAVEDAGVTPPGQYLTGDHNLVNVRLILEYAIDDRDGPFEGYVAQRDQVDVQLARAAETLTAEWAASRGVDEALLTGRAALPAWLAPRLTARLEGQRLGVLVQRVSVESLTAPNEVRAAFEAVNQAQTAIGVRVNEAEQEASRRARDAGAFRFKQTQEAASYRTATVSLAEAEAGAFTTRLAQYRTLRAANPDLLAAIWWDEMGGVLRGLKGRGRIDLLDEYVGAGGLDVTQFLPPGKK